MFTIKVTASSESKKTGIKRITILEEDDSETIINVSDDLHFFLGYIKVGKDGGNSVPAEWIVKGDNDLIGELYYQMGEEHPDLLDICARRVMEKTWACLKARGIDPGAKEFENARPVGGTQ